MQEKSKKDLTPIIVSIIFVMAAIFIIWGMERANDFAHPQHNTTQQK